jgi:hypothetical protein
MENEKASHCQGNITFGEGSRFKVDSSAKSPFMVFYGF